jgi:WD40 repeat protein/formylglycine-generating enzyme required for sulfatase activity
MSNSKNRNAEHNLIFAGLGLQLGIIAKDKVIRAFTEWLFDKTRPLGEILVHQKAITPEQRKTLESAVEAHIQQEGGEQKALASLNHVKDLESDLDHLADNDLNQTLDGAVTQRKLLGLDVLFSQSHDSESSSTNKKGSFSGPESKQTDRFERQHFLDSGNLGEVFFAKDTELNRTVVTKYIRPEMSGDTFKQALFHLEGEVTGALEHPSVVPVYGLGKDTKGRIYYAMRYIRGKKLSRVIAEYHCKEAGLKQEALTGLLQNFQAVCLAIEYAHSKGVLHCDIKPDNIMIGDYGEVFVVDWGLVVVCGDVKSPSEIHQMETLDPGIIPPYKPSELASSGLHEQQGGSRRGVGGTPAYMAPEQFTATMSEDISLVTPKADIYALGSTLYHILTGKAPHLPKEGIKESPDAFYFRITTGMIPTPREKDASIPKLLEQIVLKAMQVEPGDRYASARELAEDIKRYVSDEPVHAYQESGLEKARRWVRKNRALVGAAMVMLLLVTVGAMGLLFVEVKHSRELLVSKNETAEKNLELKASNKDAIDAKEKAEKETDRADKETKKALLQQDRAESWRYFSKFNRAITDLEGGLTKNGLKELASTPFPYRGWEHDFITSNFYGKYATLTSDSNGIFCYSPDGKKIAGGSDDGSIKIWDAETGKEVHNLSSHSDDSRVTSISYSPDGKKVASGSDDYSIKIWDAETGKELQTLTGHTENIYSVSFSPDGKRLLSSSGDSDGDDKNTDANHLKMWDLNTGKELAILNKQKGSVYAATFSSDGKKIASGSWDNSIKIWDAETGKELQTLKGHTSFVTSVSFSPDGKKIASGSWDNSIKIWDAETGKELQTLTGHTEEITSVSFSPNGKKIASGSWDNSIKIWDAETGKELQTLKGYTSFKTSVSFSPDGKRLLSSSGDPDGSVPNETNHLKMWDLSTGNELVGLFNKQKGFVTASTFSPDGKKIVSAGEDGNIKIWTADEKLDKTLLQGGMSNIVGMHVKNNEIVAWNSEGQIKYWDFKTGEKINENNLAFEIKGGCLLDDGKNLIVWDDLFNIWLIDITDEKPKIKINGNEHPITVFFANKKTTKTINKKGDLKTFDIETGREIKPELLGSWNGSNATFSSDGKKIARTSENYDKPANSIIIWDAKTGKKLKTLTGHNSSVTSISFSPDGKKIASGSDDMSIKIWNAETAEELQTLTGHSSRFYSISFSPDGKKIASNANDYSIKIWDAETGKELQTLTGHTEEITSVSFSPDGKKIASGSWDKSIKIWDAETAEELQTLTGHTSFVNSTSFSPDGKKIASGSDYNSIKIWDAETGKEVANLLGSENESFVGFYFTEDSNRVISCDSYGGILIWEINGSGKVKTISKPTPQINCTAFNKNAKFVARGFNDGSIKLLKASDLSEFSAIRIHDSSLIDICYYEDGKLIASGDKKGIIKIWEPESGNVRISIQGDNNPTYSLAFSSDGKTVVQEYVVEEMTKKIAWETATGKKTNLPEEKLKLPLDENKVQLNSSDKKWSLESDYKNVYLVNNELRAKRIASDKAKFAKWTKPDPVWHLDQADESGKSSQFFAEIFHLKQLLKIKPDDKTIQLRLKKCEDSYSRFLEIQKKMELAEAAGFALFAPFSETKAKEVQKKVAKNLKNEEKTDLGKGINLEMMLIPAGKFKMGSPKSELGRRPDETQHEVTLTKPYYMGKYEVTQEQWEVVMGNKPSSTKEVKLPVTKVSWEDCQEFIKKLNAKTNGGYRLPTEAEWEFACRAGTTAAYSVGDNLTKGDASINGDSTKAVGSYKPNAFGLYDMHGNVWEWCEDWKADYPAGAVIDPKGAATGEYRILRGGRFGFGPSDSRSANRDNYGVTPDSSFADGGFRLARSINSKDLLETDIKELFLKEIKEQEEKAKKEQEEKAKKEAEAKLKKEAEDAKVKEAQKKAAMILNKEVEVKTELEKGINLEMVLIPAGKFIMGSPVSEKNHRKDETEHEVTLTKPFYMGKYEVTQEQYEAMMGNNPSKIKGAKLPVTEVSWLDCQEFIKKLNAKTNGGYRLPTEAEWEYACRAGTTTAYSFGDSITKDEANVAWGTSTKMVGSYKPNAFGLYDMHGNVWEWCEDWKADYPKESVIDPKGPATGQYRLLRGGSFTGAGSHSRAANWWGTLPATKENDYLGLRLARTP